MKTSTSLVVLAALFSASVNSLQIKSLVGLSTDPTQLAEVEDQQLAQEGAERRSSAQVGSPIEERAEAIANDTEAPWYDHEEHWQDTEHWTHHSYWTHHS
jgi:hypothetical protein